VYIFTNQIGIEVVSWLDPALCVGAKARVWTPDRILGDVHWLGMAFQQNDAVARKRHMDIHGPQSTILPLAIDLQY
jgi:hypothetical protein